jgi:hypothetical protein
MRDEMRDAGHGTRDTGRKTGHGTENGTRDGKHGGKRKPELATDATHYLRIDNSLTICRTKHIELFDCRVFTVPKFAIFVSLIDSHIKNNPYDIRRF